MKNIAIIGGDRRENILIERLRANGYNLKVLKNVEHESRNNVKYSKNLNKVLENVNVVIAPLSGTDKKGNLKSTYVEENIKLDKRFFDLLSKKTLFLIGSLVPKIKKIIDNNKNIEVVELTKLDELAIMNAIPTAEGALKIAIEKTDKTIYKSNSIVLGLGRVGLTLAWRLKELGSNVYSATREKGAIARGKDLGLEMINYDNLNFFLPRMNIIFNTVPALILDQNRLIHVNKKSLIIDLASSPGGTDFEAAKEKNINSMLAAGIPGKTSPVTAGEILSDIIIDIIEDKGFNL